MESKDSLISKLNEDNSKRDGEARVALKDLQESTSRVAEAAAELAATNEKQAQAHIRMVSRRV
jgi:hypothetical protein